MGSRERRKELEKAEDKAIRDFAESQGMSTEEARQFAEKVEGDNWETDPTSMLDTDDTVPVSKELAELAQVREEDPEDMEVGPLDVERDSDGKPISWDEEQADSGARTEEEIEAEFKEPHWGKKTISPFDGVLPDTRFRKHSAIKRAQHIESGKFNGVLTEAVPKYNDETSYGKPTCEKIYKGDNNQWIILGRDRNAGADSGYGGKGHTRAGAIDIVVGLQGHAPSNGMTVEKNFGSMNTGMPGDAARIYISQRADIDNYFGICDGYVGNSKLDSAIALKADSVRILANKGIKIVTGGAPQQKTSLYGDIDITYGIDLIAGNRDNVNAKRIGDGLTQTTQKYLQPIPKGANLKDFLSELLDSVLALNVLMSEFANRQIAVNGTLMGGIVLSAGATGPITGGFNPATIAAAQLSTTLINSGVSSQLILHRKELNNMNKNFLLSAGPYYINSRYNRTN
tara:strand:+ start:173 stop:1540 length:1368 start_codon:yes stop_codon:yes gene_type:complete